MKCLSRMGLVSWVRPHTRLGNWSTRGRRDQLMRDQSGECTGVGWVAHTIGDAGVGSVGSVWLVGWLVGWLNEVIDQWIHHLDPKV
jgi:hypothetical protein